MRRASGWFVAMALVGCGSAQDGPDVGEATATAVATTSPTGTGEGDGASATATGSATASLPPPPAEANRFIGGAAWDGSGKRMLLYCRTECKGSRLPVHIWDVGSESPKTIDAVSDKKGDARLVSWSSRGTHVFASVGEKLFVTSADGKPVTVVDAPAVYDQFALSPDESQLAWATASGELHLVDMKTKADTKVAQLHDPNMGANSVLEWSPKGDWIMVATGEPPSISVYDVKAKKVRPAGGAYALAEILPKGDGIVVAADDGFVGILDPATGKPRATLRKARAGKPDESLRVSATLGRDGKKLVVAGTDLVMFDLEAKKSTTLIGKLEATFPATSELSPLGTEIAIDVGEDVIVVDTSVVNAPPRVAASSLVGYGNDGTLVLMGDTKVLTGFRKGNAVWTIKLAEDPSTMSIHPQTGLLALTVGGRLRIVRVSTGKSVNFELVTKDKGKTIQVSPIGITKKADVDAVLGGAG